MAESCFLERHDALLKPFVAGEDKFEDTPRSTTWWIRSTVITEFLTFLALQSHYPFIVALAMAWHNKLLAAGVVYSSFDDMRLSSNVLRGVYSHGFEKPSPIQQQVIASFIKGCECLPRRRHSGGNEREETKKSPVRPGPDILAEAPSGTGTTCVYLIGLLQRLKLPPAQNSNAKTEEGGPSRMLVIQKPQVLILGRRREFTIPVAHILKQIGGYVFPDPKADCKSFSGGENLREQLTACGEGVMVGVGTPGKVLDLVQRGAFHLENISLLVIDELDCFLESGFEEVLADLMKFLPLHIQVALFTQRTTPQVLNFSNRYQKWPLRIDIPKPLAPGLTWVDQYYVGPLEEEYKLDTLLDLWAKFSPTQMKVFVNTRRKAEWLLRNFTTQISGGDDTPLAECITGETTPGQRDDVKKRFEAGEVKVLVSVDVLARGYQSVPCPLTINYDLPRDNDLYLHRVGQAGQLRGKKSYAITLASVHELAALRYIETQFKTKIKELPENVSLE